jgi:predicted methyltransferase
MSLTHRVIVATLPLCCLACARASAPCGEPVAAAPAVEPAAGAERSAATPRFPAPAAEAPPAQAPAVDYAAIVAAADRSEADRALDGGRKPAETLAFFGVKPGMRVAEIAAGAGYTSELLARAVGPNGRVYGVNSKWVLERFAEAPWSARLATPVMANVERLDREFDDPFPAEVKDLDLVVNVLFYHDTVWQKADRAKMNAAIFAALKPGGHYVVIDHSAAAGHGVDDAQTLHRIEASVVQAEVEAAGFRLVEQGEFLKNPDDARDWNASPRAAAERRGTSDRFAFKFERP